MTGLQRYILSFLCEGLHVDGRDHQLGSGATATEIAARAAYLEAL